MVINYPIRVLVVDDSPFMRKVIREMVNRSPFLEVVGTARSGDEALDLVADLSPDVILLDLIMPGMDGVTFIRQQLSRKRIPIVVCSTATQGGGEFVSAFEAGAVEFVQKPTALADDRVFSIQEQIVRSLVAASNARLDHMPEAAQPSESKPVLQRRLRKRKVEAVVIGVSTGGPQALRFLLPQFPANFPVPLAIVLHMPVGYTQAFANKLDEMSAIEVLEGQEGLEMRPGRAILAQAGFHLRLIKSEQRVIANLDQNPESLHRPSVDVLFRSAADVYGPNLLGVVLTGMGDDGTAGAAWIKAQGGMVFAEDVSSSVVYGMPRSVIEAGLADHIYPLNQIANGIMETI